jgi:hypothetical protein
MCTSKNLTRQDRRFPSFKLRLRKDEAEDEVGAFEIFKSI